ncbi:OmpH family outer membrane protein [Zunongwangia sp. HGR-M22]|uniref:OmpH family outer membrane protein n=1 Tax=Zunongwangia sp. HGR-M22 TaxID=3015168 RepID=UPI0022DE8734|nr:OmpH family outer membrane protein [Zunongwangia sp. HGR-M22]WBL26459.1 OmpH family outer membrane protein [Zunongwangia sp. HGR-M22]
MKKFSVLITFLFLAIAANAQTKIGTIDAEYIISKMPEINNVNDGVKAYNESLQADVENAIQAYEGLIKNYQDSTAVFTEDVKKQRENQILGLENEIKQFRQRSQVMMQMKRNELTQPLYKKIDAAMQEVINEEGYTQIFHAGGGALAYSQQGSDITEKVMEKLGISIEEVNTTQPSADSNNANSN